MNTRTLILIGASAAALSVAACNRTEDHAPAAPAPAESMAPAPETMGPTVGGAAMNANETIVANASRASNLTTLVSALQTAGLTETLNGAGPFTVFAPDNAAFEKLPAAERENLMQPAQKQALTRLLTYHVVPGRMTTADLTTLAAANNGVATLTTVQGGKLTVRDAGGGNWTVTDEKGGTSTITQADVAQSNGVVYVVDTVLMPK